MSDLAQRLRDCRDDFMTEAADEIERLQALAQANQNSTDRACQEYREELALFTRQRREASAEIAQLRADAEKLLRPHVKWLLQAAEEIRSGGHHGWGNTCAFAAEAIEDALAAISKDAEGEKP